MIGNKGWLLKFLIVGGLELIKQEFNKNYKTLKDKQLFFIYYEKN